MFEDYAGGHHSMVGSAERPKDQDGRVFHHNATSEEPRMSQLLHEQQKLMGVFSERMSVLAMRLEGSVLCPPVNPEAIPSPEGGPAPYEVCHLGSVVRSINWQFHTLIASVEHILLRLEV